MDLTIQQEAQRLHDKHAENAKSVCDELISLLCELNSIKLCQFHKEIDYYNGVMKELENIK
jgi:hypothetical protein